MSYKRSQIEDAICISRGARGKAQAKILMRIKRLLASDRELPLKAQRRGKSKSVYAFFSEDAPGKGAEIEFTSYEAFALDLALYLLDQGLPHKDTVELLRLLRPELEPMHRSVISRPPPNGVPIDLTREGDPVLSADKPVFVIVNRTEKSNSTTPLDRFNATILSGAGGWLDHVWRSAGRTLTMAEITLTAQFLEQHLREIDPRNRGRT